MLKKYWQLLKRYMLPERRRVLVLAVLVFSSMGLSLIIPQILRFFIDTAGSLGSMAHLTAAAVLFIVLSLLIQILQVAGTYFGEKVAWTSTNELRADLADHCLRLDMTFHNTHKPGELIERIDGDVANLADFFSRFVVRLSGNLLFLLGVLLLLFAEDWRIGLAMTVYSTLTLGALMLMRNLVVPHWRAARQVSADLFGFLEEQLAGTEDICANGARDFAMAQLFRASGNRLRAMRRAGLMSMMLRATIVGLNVFGQLLAMGVGYYLYRAGVVTVGAVVMVHQYTQMIFRPLMQITREVEQLQRAGASLERIEELLEQETLLNDGSGPPLPAGPLEVGFDDVTFGYQADDPVLRGISFQLAPGKVMGVLGRTGSGKTTLARLLFRLYDPQSGSVRLGGPDLREHRIGDLRGNIGMVTQNVQLFRGSVRDNLTFFGRDVSDERIREIVHEMGLSEWFDLLPDGLDTELRGRDGGLSAGEAQLLALTRVFLRDPGLVILDEASSRLDPATEAHLETALDSLLRGRTGIIIAHRLTTLDRADDILILEDGRISEHGNRAALADDPGSRLRRLLSTGLEEAMA